MATLSVFISVDMEGIAGITTLRQCTRGTDDYAWARQLMTAEASAAVAGAADTGARRIVVSDSHADMGNLLPHELDPRAELVQGTPKLPWSMLAGIDAVEEPFSAAVFIGYHAGAGTAAAVLDHTYSGAFTQIRVNGDAWNETHLNAALAGSFGVPVVFVSGDRACCDQAKERLPWLRTVAVKEGLGNRTGRSQSPSRAQAAIRGLVRESIKGVEHGNAEIWAPEGPFTLEADTVNTNVADAIALAPGSERSAPLAVRYEASDVPTVYRALLTWLALARHHAPVSPVV
ncbi:MAG TPA: M55 family metallopeptidase [Actinomycetota bacterium]|nr:M55 family metallopeptidase [Actinomycetota bacterium]